MNDKIKKYRNRKHLKTPNTYSFQGKVDHVNPNFAYIISSENEKDIWVKTSNLHYAVHGDIVQGQIIKYTRKGTRPEGKVIKIVQRAGTQFVGIIQIFPTYSFVMINSQKKYFDVLIFPEKMANAKPNDKVIVNVEKWHNRSRKSPIGKVIKVLGQSEEHETEIHSIMAEFGLPFEFSKKIQDSAASIGRKISENEIKKRRDFRDTTTFTIDPFDAKDFDDALSITELNNNLYEIGIHIADVSHYVVEDSDLDKEAMDRGTSVYLVDRTIPMLPEELSNDLCSLRPQEEKLTFSVVFQINDKGEIKGCWFGKTIIKSDRRFTYEEVQTIIESHEGPFANEIYTLNKLAHQLRKERFEKGAINFETIEVNFKLDESGKPISIYTKERKEAHKMIEEFMLLANREVAYLIYHKYKKTFIYRTHGDPDTEKLKNLYKLVKKFGYNIDVKDKISQHLNRLLENIEGKPEQNILESIAIRSMAKAEYTIQPRKHFGLGFSHYTHFTSPIRRYPDLMVHRLLGRYLSNGVFEDDEELEVISQYCNEQEKRALAAERASIKYKQVEFMQKMLGQVFDGIVTGVIEWGIFVEIIETKCEGKIRISTLKDDFYQFDEKNFRIVGKHNKKTITLGDTLQVILVRTSIFRRIIELELVDN